MSREYGTPIQDRTYENAIDILNSRRRLGRPEAKDVSKHENSQVMPSLKGKPDLRGRPSIFGMADWLSYLGHSDSDINKLNIIHVAGTKGKGSTCAFAESFLRAHGRRCGFPQRTGLYTSPHLMFPEERIRINFEPLSKQLFAKYFFEVWEALQANCPAEEFETAPRYLQLYALVSFHAFLQEGVDAAIYETHHGGEFDATNFITKPVVTAITTLGMDHVAQLGPSIENIAWHKAGIMKQGAVAVAAPQSPGPARVLINRAHEKGVVIKFVEPLTIHDDLPVHPLVQRVNCMVARSAADAFLAATAASDANHLTAEDVQQGLAQFHWPGRFEVVVHEPFHWFLDSAHNELSMSQAATWYAQMSRDRAVGRFVVWRVLIFSQDSIQRDGADVLASLATSLHDESVQFDHVIFTTYVPTAQTTRSDYCIKDMPELASAHPPTPPEKYPALWRAVDSSAEIHVFPYIDEALAFARALAEPDGHDVHTLVTGSQHLVGGVLRLFEGQKG